MNKRPSWPLIGSMNSEHLRSDKSPKAFNSFIVSGNRSAYDGHTLASGQVMSMADISFRISVGEGWYLVLNIFCVLTLLLLCRLQRHVPLVDFMNDGYHKCNLFFWTWTSWYKKEIGSHFLDRPYNSLFLWTKNS